MKNILHKKWIGIWSEVLSPTIFKLDIVESFKYRKKQALLFFSTSLLIFSLIIWFFFYEISSVGEGGVQTALVFLFFLPLLITLLFWFRACLIYDFSERVITKKQTRASLIIKISIGSFGFYYCYWMYQLWQIGH